MDRVLIAGLTLLPAIPAVVRLVRVVRTRSNRGSRSVIVWGALTMGAGATAYAVVALSVFSDVARAAPTEKANVLAVGLSRGYPALAVGLLVGAVLCILGGITRSLFRADVDQP